MSQLVEKKERKGSLLRRASKLFGGGGGRRSSKPSQPVQWTAAMIKERDERLARC